LTVSEPLQVACIGLGRIGLTMARRLIRAGHGVVVYDLNSAAAQEFAEAGVRFALSAADASSRVDVVLVSMPNPAASAAVLFADGGIAAGAQSGTLIIDTTTLGVRQSIQQAKTCALSALSYVDAPVSMVADGGGVPAYTFMVGGPAESFALVKRLLDDVGRVVHVGAIGLGSAVKLINQAVFVAHQAAFAEGLALAEEFGVDTEAILDVFTSTSGGSTALVGKYDDIRETSGRQFAVESALHYLDLVAEDLGHADVATPVFDATRTSLRRAARSGFGRRDLIAARAEYLKGTKP
jgi:3-hydroxyisobutyrate dehydrogenase-like beta-hydroxyacid dehydrogenase